MPASKRRMALKTALLAPAGTIMPWGVQRLLSGEPATGAAAVVIGAIFIFGFVAIQEYDLPYEQEIVDAIADQPPGETAETAKDVSEQVGEQVTDNTEQEG